MTQVIQQIDSAKGGLSASVERVDALTKMVMDFV